MKLQNQLYIWHLMSMIIVISGFIYYLKSNNLLFGLLFGIFTIFLFKATLDFEEIVEMVEEAKRSAIPPNNSGG